MRKRGKKLFTMFNIKKATGLHITTNHTGKMSGMYSLSTSVLLNENCKKRMENEDLVCHECFANAVTNRYKDLEKCLANNTELLTAGIIPENEIPFINAHSFRFEAFGDLNNMIQVVNYFNICKKNKKTTFALWTKNPWFVKEAIEAGHKKPSNLVIIYSSPFLNRAVPLDRMQAVYPFIDKVFTVYKSEEAAKENNAVINCGSLNCIECLRCYSKRTTGVISELLK